VLAPTEALVTMVRYTQPSEKRDELLYEPQAIAGKPAGTDDTTRS
jgi:hypothetical protein